VRFDPERAARARTDIPNSLTAHEISTSRTLERRVRGTRCALRRSRTIVGRGQGHTRLFLGNPQAVDSVLERKIAIAVSTYLVRDGYIQQVSGLLPAEWRSMSEAQLTSFLTEKYTEEELHAMFVEKYAERAAIKSSFRKFNIISALVIGLIWARETIKEGEWGTAAAKVGGMGMAAYVFN
jgi:hypothetical protein